MIFIYTLQDANRPYPAMRLIQALCLMIALLLSPGSRANDLELSETEQQWLRLHPVIRIAVAPDFAPFEWLNEAGEHLGISAEYLKLIEHNLNVLFEVVPVSSWNEAIRLAQTREVDVLPALGITEQRQTFLLFTDTYQTIPGVIVSGKTQLRIDDLTGRTVAVVRGSYWDDLLSDYPDKVNIERVSHVEFGAQLASLNAVDALVTDLASATHAINSSGINNLHIVSDPDQKLGSLKLSMGIRSDQPILHSIMNKALNSIGFAQRQKIHTKWIQLKPPSFWMNKSFLLSLAAALSLIILIFIGFLIWTRTLTRKVEARTYDLNLAQSKLMQAEKMESIGRLAAGIAHEVKNPLAIIRMGMDYLAPDVAKDQTSTEVVADINDAVERANTVIHGLLDFSRDKQLTLSAGNINDAIHNALHLVEHELHQRNIHTQLSLDPNLPELKMDSIKMQQVFINLFMNAAHAMKHDGQLQIRSRLLGKHSSIASTLRKDSPLNDDDRIICIEIADTGPGIRAQDKAKIFELFYTTKALGEGTGLGLSVTRNIIKLHHGSIDIDNRDEGGAQVTILLKI